MRYSELREAPVQDYQLIGDFTKPASFDREIDRKLLSKPKAVEKFHNFFKNTPYNFKFYFVNSPEIKTSEQLNRYGPITSEELMKTYGLDIKEDRNAITGIFVGNYGAALVPMTPWIVAHRLSHGFFGAGIMVGVIPLLGTTEYSKTFTEFLNKFGLAYTDFRKAEWLAGDLKTLTDMDVVNYIGTMGSARNKKLRNIGEFLDELFAQYLLKGKVTFNLADSHFLINALGYNRLVKMQNLSELNRLIQNVEQFCNQMMPKLLDEAIGRIFII